MTARGPVPGAEGTLFRGYAPLVALVALILAMAFLAPTIAPERDVVTRPGVSAESQRSSPTRGVGQERHDGTDPLAPAPGHGDAP